MRDCSSGVARQRTVLAVAAVLALWSSSGSGFNIDTLQPIVREPPPAHSGQEFDLFGYSAVLHSRDQVATLSNTFIVIAAPNGTAVGAVVDNTGVVFECPLTQGSCMPLRGSGTGMDVRLYDTEANTFGLKGGQFLGVSMDSRGNRFIVCGHKFQDSNFFPETGGVCYISDRSLTNFRQLLPCFSNQNGLNRLSYQRGNDHCGAGASVSLLNNNNIALGAPAYGYRNTNFRGATIILNDADGEYYVSHRDDPEGHPFRADDEDARFFAAYSDYHRGYSVTRGHVFQRGPNAIEDIIVGLPRGHAGRFLGAVGIHRQVFNEETVTLSDGRSFTDNYLGRLEFLFEGDQLASYFGGTVAAVDVNGDGYDEVFVAATLYTPTRDLPEAGRVTVFLNLRGTLSDRNTITIEGPRRAYGRFGHAMTGVGDVNADGFQDIAISAPFRFGSDATDTYSGAVYIYAGSNNGLQGSPIQTIESSSLNLEAPILSGLKSFGAHLFSFDVDNNGYNDLLVGAFQSRKVFVLRTRPLLNVITTTIANISSFNETGQCEFMQQPRSCFSVDVCIRTTGRGFRMGQQFNVSYNLSSDQRVFFGAGGEGSTLIRDSVIAVVNGTSSCNTHIVYLTAAEIEIETPLAVTASPFVADSLVQLDVTNGNPMPDDLANRPATLVSGQTQALVLPSLDCGEDTVCRTNLQVQAASLRFLSRLRPGEVFSQITIGLVSDIVISFNLTNGGPENAYRSVAVIQYSTAFAFSRIEGNNGVTCTQLGQGSVNILTCQVAGLLMPGGVVPLGIRLVALAGRLSGLEQMVTFQVNTSSGGEELNPADNVALLTAGVVSQTDAQVILSASGLQFVTLTSSATDLATVSDFRSIGRQVTFNASIINHGPSAIRSGSVRITWPIAHRCTGNTNFLFYLASVQLMGVQGACSVNPSNARDYLMIATQQTSVSQVDDDVTSAPNITRSNSTVFSHPFVAGSEDESSFDCSSADLAASVSVECNSVDDACVAITCDINGHLPNQQGVISVVGYIDDSFFASQQRDWSIAVRANYTITDQAVTEVTGNDSRANSAQVTVSIISQLRPTVNAEVPIWVIVVPIVLALIFIVIVVILLYACGFFRRKNWRKLQEEKDNENENVQNESAENENGTEETAGQELPQKEDIAYVTYN